LRTTPAIALGVTDKAWLEHRGKQTQLRGKSLKGGFTIWKMKSGSPAPIHVATLEKAVIEALK
jgi:hypothetical protein